ncbi:MAG: hypothetical protein IIB12_07705 [Chloroflexi bacterium]|nr:hypothetical protein [Chloroflexota bacterium]MCH8284326.1 hypothetical protein [Chloroflexota bacterium]
MAGLAMAVARVTGLGLAVALAAVACAGSGGGAATPPPPSDPGETAPADAAAPADVLAADAVFVVESAGITRDTPFFDATSDDGRSTAFDREALETAQPFTLPSVQGPEVSLVSYQGQKNLVLLFYRGFW